MGTEKSCILKLSVCTVFCGVGLLMGRDEMLMVEKKGKKKKKKKKVESHQKRWQRAQLPEPEQDRWVGKEHTGSLCTMEPSNEGELFLLKYGGKNQSFK